MTKTAARRHFTLLPSRQRTAAALLAAALLAACNPVDHAGSAREFIQQGDYASAAIALGNAIQFEPQSVELRVLMADVLERRFDRVGAENSLKKAIELGGDQNVLLPRLALMIVDRGDMDGIVRAYQGVRLQDPQADARLRGIVALALLALKRPGPVRDQLHDMPPVAEVRLARAQLLVADGKAKQALALLDVDNKTEPAPWWMLRAGRRVAQAAGEHELSLQLMQRAHDAVPWHLGVVGEYGEALIVARRFDDATKVRDRLRKEAPQNFWTHYLSAQLHNLAGRVDEAHASALAVLKVSPDHLPSALLAASAELRRGDVQVAETRLATLAQKNPDSLPVLRLLAQAQLRMGHAKEAALTMRRGFHLAPGDPELLQLRARAEAAAGRRKEAAETLAELVKLRPDDADALLALAEARAALGDRAAVRPLVERAAAAAQDGETAGRVIAVALRLGDTEWARRIGEQQLARTPKDPQARLALAAVKSTQGDQAAAWADTLAVLDDTPAHAGAIHALTGMARTPAQHRELRARHAKALDAGGAGARQVLDYAALLRLDAPASREPLAVVDKAVQLYPLSVSARRALVDELLRAGDTQRAVNVAQTGATMANAPTEAAELLADVYARFGKGSQAAEVYRKLVQEYPQRAELRYRLARVEADNGRIVEATTLLRGLMTERPFDPAAFAVLAELTARDNLPEALSIARQMGERPELRTASLMLAGDLLRGAGKHDDALAQYVAASKAGAGATASLRIAALLDRMGRRPAAEQELAEALRRHPDDASVVQAAAARAQAAGDVAQAVALLQKAVDKAPDNPVLLNDLAWAQLAAGKPEAMANARRALAMLPNNPLVLHTMGLVLSKAGQRDDAIAALRAAANLAPTSAMPRLHLAEHLLAAGDRPGAAAAARGADGAQLAPADKARLDKLKADLGIA